MLNALEGKRANPRARPPHMTGAGLWGQPTVVNNVETLCCVPPVLRHGAQWWLDQGLTAEGGSKLYTSAGTRQAARAGGSCRWARPCARSSRSTPAACCPATRRAAIIPGGASSPLRRRRGLRRRHGLRLHGGIGSRLGTGTMFVLDDQTCPVGTLANLMHFFAQESCGWCTPCREGLPWARDLLNAIEDGRGRARGPRPAAATSSLDNAADLPFCDTRPGAIEPLESGLGCSPRSSSATSRASAAATAWSAPPATSGGARATRRQRRCVAARRPIGGRRRGDDATAPQDGGAAGSPRRALPRAAPHERAGQRHHRRRRPTRSRAVATCWTCACR